MNNQATTRKTGLPVGAGPTVSNGTNGDNEALVGRREQDNGYSDRVDAMVAQGGCNPWAKLRGKVN